MQRPILAFVTILLLATITVLLLATVAVAQEAETYNERLEYDAETGQWVELPPPIPGTEGGDLAIARSQLARNEYKRARKSFETWFETYPESALWPEAIFYAAETEILAEDADPKSGDLLWAHERLEELLDGWPGGDLADRALRKELIIAEMLLFKGRKQRIWGGLLWLSGTEEALEILAGLIDVRAPGTPVAQQALRIKADYHYANGEFREAEKTYARLMREYPRGRHHKIAMLRCGQSALARFPGVKFDEADLLESEVYLRDFYKRYPTEAAEQNVPQMLSRITESLAHKEYTVAQYYERTNRSGAAIYYYRWIADRYPATTWGAQAHDRLIALGALDPNPIEEDYETGEDLETDPQPGA